MTTKRRRWSANLEAQRAGAEQAARASIDLLEQAATRIARASSILRSNPDLADRMLAQAAADVSRALANQERITRLMVEATHGMNE